ncbi:MAG TPA: chemotaxis protein CheW [Acetobacteraceae bacterium]|jgi:purine-binding chemotaxis protein CheW|nr:chemotaxis protein CheW [Acetobacteraceae bacterium]
MSGARTSAPAAPANADQESQDYVTVLVGAQLFGIPVLQVQDVLGRQAITRVPLGPPAVAGALNLRGRIVTAIDTSACLGLRAADTAPAEATISIVVEHRGELYSLIVDQVGEVMPVDIASLEANPLTLDPSWRDISRGVHKLQERLMVVLDIAALLDRVVAIPA